MNLEGRSRSFLYWGTELIFGGEGFWRVLVGDVIGLDCGEFYFLGDRNLI